MSTNFSRRAMMTLAALALTMMGCEERKVGSGVASTATAKPRTSAGGDTGVPGVTDTTIKVGAWAPLSGPAAAWSVVLKGSEAYFKHINESGGIHGRKIEFIIRDDQYNPAKTPAVARELVEKENVFAIMGGIGTANGRAVADYLEKKNVPFFTPASGDKFWSEGGKKNVYTVFPKYESEGEILGHYAATELKAKKIAVLYQNDDFGKQGLEGVKKGVAKIEGAEVVAEVSCLPTDTDLSGQASQIAGKAPDVLVLYAGIKQSVTVVKTLDAQKKKPQLVSSFVLSDPLLFKLGGESWNGTVTASTATLPDADDESVGQYRNIVKKYGGGKLPVGTFTQAGFLFAMPFVAALDKAGKDLTRDKFYKALHTMKNYKAGGPHWKGDSFGPAITFSPTQRLGNNKVFLAKANEGKWEKVTDWLSPGGGATKNAAAKEEK